MAYNKMDAYRGVENWDKYKWRITIDEDVQMYTCPVCGCRMQKPYYDIACGTRAFNFCPYCGEDMRPEQIGMEGI